MKRIAIGSFSNLQGLEIGARNANFLTPFSNDIDNLAEIVAPVISGHDAKEIFLTKDIKLLTFKDDIQPWLKTIGFDIKRGDIDLFVGGPPCFGITLLSSTTRAVYNELNFLMIEMLRVVREMQPKVVLMEQVPPLLSAQMRPFLNYFINEICLLGNYHWKINILNAVNFGCYQSRKRAIIMLVRKDLDILPSFPQPQPIEINKQSAYAAIGAELIKVKGFKNQSGNRIRLVNGIDNVFPTLTSGSVEIFRDGLWQDLTIEDRKILAHMDKYDFAGKICDAELSKKLGMMVLPPFSEALCKHIHSEILEKAAA